MDGLVQHLTLSLALKKISYEIRCLRSICRVSDRAFRPYMLPLKFLSSLSFVVMLKGDSEFEYPQCEIRARQHWYLIPHYFCLSFYCEGHNVVSLV